MKQATGNGTTNGAGAVNRQKEVQLIGFKNKQVCSISDLLSHKNYLQLVCCPEVLFKPCSNRRAKASAASLWRTCTWTRRWLASPSECLIIKLS